MDPAAAYPPAPGERVARLKITLPGITVGRVPLVVSSVPPPPPIDDGPWWERAADALVVCGRVGRGRGAGLTAAVRPAFRGPPPFGC